MIRLSLTILLIVIIGTNAHFNLKEKLHLKAPERLEFIDTKTISTKWFEQTLDHFTSGPDSKKTWKQKYYVNDQFEKPNGPVFVFIGGEGPADIGWMSAGSWIVYAKQFGALAIQLEHRYYGDSHPTEDLSLENMRYLNSTQALADLANFITAMNKEMNLEGRKWVTFGGSYPGSLSLWAREKYPNLITGAISSSGPVLAKVDFFEYLGVVDSDFKVTKAGCAEAISSAMKSAEALYKKGPAGWKTLEKEMNLCGPLDGKNMKDVATLFQSFIGTFESTAQYNDQTSPNIKDLCDMMTNESLGTPMQRLKKTIGADQQCIDFSYEDSIAGLMDTTNGNADRCWIYQTCNEFGWYQSSDLPGRPYSDLFPVESDLEMCRDVFGNQFTDAAIQNNVDQSNNHYGAKHPKDLKNVVIIHGSFDPWHAMGILEELNPTVPVMVINGTSHCSNMKNPGPNDQPGLPIARELIVSNIKKWVD